jgi:hypothetical protein
MQRVVYFIRAGQLAGGVVMVMASAKDVDTIFTRSEYVLTPGASGARLKVHQETVARPEYR